MLHTRPRIAALLLWLAAVAACDGDDATPSDGAAGAVTLEIFSGDGQTGLARAALSEPLVVVAKGADGRRAPGVAVRWSVTVGGGGVSGQAVTDADGRAQAQGTLGPSIGLHRFTATADAAVGAGVTFTATAVPPSSDGLRIEQVSGGDQSGAPGALLPVPLRVRVTRADGAPAVGVAIAWTAADAVGSVVGEGPTDADGYATARATLGPVAGAQAFTATLAGAVGSPVTFRAQAVRNNTSGALVVVSGDGQRGRAGQPLVEPLVVRAEDALGAPVAGVRLMWFPRGQVTAETVTGPDGLGQTSASLGPTLGPQEFLVEAVGFRFAKFSATADPDPADLRLFLGSGDGQSAPPGAALEAPLVVTVLDGVGQPAAAVTVRWSATAGDGSVSEATTTTDIAGSAMVIATLGDAADAVHTFLAEVDGADGSPIAFSARSFPEGAVGRITPVSGKAQGAVVNAQLPERLVVRLTDLLGAPVGGVRVSWAIPGGEGALSAPVSVSDADGQAVNLAWLGLATGAYTFTAEVTGYGGSPARFEARAFEARSVPRTLLLVGGDRQRGPPGGTMPAPLVVEVRDASGEPVSDLPVTFAVVTGGGRVGVPETRTDRSGQARTTLTLGPGLGAQNFTASVGLAIAGFVGPRLTVTATAEAPSR